MAFFFVPGPTVVRESTRIALLPPQGCVRGTSKGSRSLHPQGKRFKLWRKNPTITTYVNLTTKLYFINPIRTIIANKISSKFMFVADATYKSHHPVVEGELSNLHNLFNNKTQTPLEFIVQHTLINPTYDTGCPVRASNMYFLE